MNTNSDHIRRKAHIHKLSKKQLAKQRVASRKLFYIRTVQLLISDVGGIATPILSVAASAAITWVTFIIAHKIPFLADQVNQLNGSTIAASLATFLTGIINFGLNRILKKESYELQDMLIANNKDIERDGWLGEQTHEALKEILKDKMDRRIDLTSDDPNIVHREGDH